jgi:hypothetical protein
MRLEGDDDAERSRSIFFKGSVSVLANNLSARPGED